MSVDREVLVALDAAQVYGTRRAAAIALYQAMSDLSEELYCAGWMTGTDMRLWRAVSDPTDDGAWGRGWIERHEAERLWSLAELARGWWAETEDVAPCWVQFVSLAEWRDMAPSVG